MYQKIPTIAVAAGKGGVGKSTVTASLAIALKSRGLNVGVLDADIYGPSIRILLPEEHLPSNRQGIISPAISKGIRTVSMAYFRPENGSVSVRAPIANRVIEQFLNTIDWGNIDILLIDFPPGTGDIQLTLAQKASITSAIMVTTPQKIATQDVQRAIQLFRNVHIPITGIVENMSYFDVAGQRTTPFGEGGGELLSAKEQLPLLAKLPLIPALSQAGDTGLSAEPFKEFIDLAEKITLEELKLPTCLLTTPTTLNISWEGKAHQFNLSELQKSCPCAACTTTTPQVKEGVTADKIDLVGHYGIKLTFSSGCSEGIYPYTSLCAFS